jgi:hypothetical protein
MGGTASFSKTLRAQTCKGTTGRFWFDDMHIGQDASSEIGCAHTNIARLPTYRGCCVSQCDEPKSPHTADCWCGARYLAVSLAQRRSADQTVRPDRRRASQALT